MPRSRLRPPASHRSITLYVNARPIRVFSQISEHHEKTAVKLAPFKRFTKMLKSRSSGDSRSNSVESEEQQRQINQPSLPSVMDEYANAAEMEPDKNCLAIRNEQTIPSSPPPSYEHVLEEVSTRCIAAIGDNGRAIYQSR